MNTSDKILIEKLVANLKSGDHAAFEMLYDNYSGALYGVIFKIVRSEDDAQDVLQDSLLKIWKNIQKYDAKKGSFFTWMLNISRNSAIDRYRKIRREGKVEIQTLETNVDIESKHVSVTKTDTIGLKEEVNKLSEDHQLMIDYIYFKGYTQQEVADELKMPLGTVKTRIRSAVIELRKVFKSIILFWI